MKKIILIIAIACVGFVSFGQNGVNINSNNGDVQIRRYSAGETSNSDWKRALVPGNNFGLTTLYVNYGNDFDKTIINGIENLEIANLLNVGGSIQNSSFKFGGNDFQMRRSSAGDNTWRRALVPGYIQGNNTAQLFVNYGGDFEFTRVMGNKLIVDGNLGIGTNNPDSKLTVKGKIHCEEVKVDLSVPADYVFEKYYNGSSTLKADYTMPTLKEVEAYTKENHHLPEMPSAKEIQENGLYLKEMTNLLLQKIEELTLYTIAQEKRINALETKLTSKE